MYDVFYRIENQDETKKNRNGKTGVINDPFGQPTDPASLILKFWDERKDRRHKYVRTDNLRENSDHYRPWRWVGRVDQK